MVSVPSQLKSKRALCTSQSWLPIVAADSSRLRVLQHNPPAMEVPGGWGAGAAGTDGGAPAPATASVGVWDQELYVNETTSITVVSVPLYDSQNPLQGTKPARVRRLLLPHTRPSLTTLRCATQESFFEKLKLRNNNKNPLNLRKKLEKDGITQDVYFNVAPGQSTLTYSASTNAVKPDISMPPAVICAQIISIAKEIDFIRNVIIYIVDSEGKKKQVDLQYLQALNIPIKAVPNLYKVGEESAISKLNRHDKDIISMKEAMVRAPLPLAAAGGCAHSPCLAW